MILVNHTSDNIFIFAGIFVPANGELPVAAESEHAVEASPLVQDYVKAGALSISKPAVVPPARSAPPPPAAPAKQPDAEVAAEG